jgi:hypothetical protein
MMKVYADESGVHGGSVVLVIGSYIGDLDTWLSVEEAIQRANRHSGRLFHAADCAHLVNDFYGMDRDRSRRIYKRMIHIINRHNIVGLSAGIFLSDYSKLWPRAPKQSWIDWLKEPYRLCFKQYIIELCHHFVANNPGEKISIAMEENHDLYPVAAGAFLEMKHDIVWPNHVLLETIAPYSKQAVNLQTADILAYETYLMQERKQFNPRKIQPRKSLLALLNNKLEGRCWDEKSLLSWRCLQQDGDNNLPSGESNGTAQSNE